MNSEILASSSAEREMRSQASSLCETPLPNRLPFGPRTKRRIVPTGISDDLQAANKFYQRGHSLEAFDIYEQLAASYPEHAVDILAELYDLYQALPDKEDRYSLYQARLFDFGIRPSDKVLDVGSGNVPFPSATHLADLAPSDNHYGRAGVPFKYVQGKPVHICDIENMDCFADKEFDFVYCSHVLEHVQSPEKACRELMRIGKRGYIETPTRGKDIWLSTAKVSNHLWSVEYFHSKLIFTEYLAEELEGLQSDLLMSMHLRPESKREKALTSLMYLKADLINTMLLWEGAFEYEVLRRELVGPGHNTGTARKTINLRPTEFPCPPRLKIFADRKYLPPDTSHTPLLIPLWGDIDDDSNTDQSRYRRYSSAGRDYFVQTDLSQADVALLPGDWTHCQLEGHKLAEAAKESDKPLVIFFFNDSEEIIPIENCIVFRTSLRRSARKPNEFAVPGWSVDFGEHYFHGQIPVREKQPKPTVGFCGFVPLEENNLRRRAVNALGASDLVRTEFLLRTEFWAGALGTTHKAIQRVRQEYVDNIAGSDYLLCIRGAGNFSYRLYEVLSSGRIPVFVDTDCVLPYEGFIDWKKYCVWVDTNDLHSIGEIIAQFHENLSRSDFIDLQKACRDLWVRWLSPEGFFANFYRHLTGVCLRPNAAPSAIISSAMTLNPVPPLSEGDFCRAIEKIVRPGWTCADVGANVGLITAVLAECVGPSGRILAFEAHPANAKILRANMKSKGYGSRVKVGNVAITDGTQSKVWLYQGRNDSSCEWNIVGHDVDGTPTKPEVEVTAAKLDTFFPEGSRLELVKIDIEGAAGPAFAGMSRLLRETRPILLIEFHDEAEWEARTLLLNSGYDLWDLEGRKLDPAKDIRRRYHCLAIPSEQS